MSGTQGMYPSQMPQQAPTPAQQQQMNELQNDYGASYPGNPENASPNADIGANGKPKPFYENHNFYNNLLNFGAATLAASGETDGRGVPISGFAAIGRGLQGMTEANQRERELQSGIRSQNVNNRASNAQIGMIGMQNAMMQQRMRMMQQYMSDVNGDNGGDPSQSQQQTGMNAPQGQPQSGMQSAPVAAASDTSSSTPASSPMPNSKLIGAIGHTESSGNFNSQNKYGYTGYMGFGTGALTTAGMYQPAQGEDPNGNQWKGTINVPGFQPMNVDQFKQNPSAQLVAGHEVLHSNAQQLQNMGAQNYIGKTVNGVQITPSSLLAGSWVAGPTGMMKFLKGDTSFKDGNGVTIPQYVNTVDQHMNDPQVTGDGSANMQALHGQRMSTLGSMMGGTEGIDGRIHTLNRQIMEGGFAGMNVDAQKDELANLYDVRKNYVNAQTNAQTDMATHRANTMFDVQNKPVSLRNSIALPDGTNPDGSVHYNIQKEPTSAERFNPQTGMNEHGFVESRPDGSTYFQTTAGADTQGEGQEAQDKELAGRSNRILDEASDQIDHAKGNLQTLQSYNDNLGNLDTGPGESYMVGLRSAAVAAMRAAGMNPSADMMKSVSSAQNVSSLASQLSAHMFSTVHNVKNSVEFNALTKTIPGIDNTKESLQFILSHGQGESLEDMSEASFLQGAAQNPQKYPQFYSHGVFDAAKAKTMFHEQVTPMAYTYMMLNTTPQGKQMIHQMLQGAPAAITKRLSAAQKSLQFLRDNNAFYNAQGVQESQQPQQPAQQ